MGKWKGLPEGSITPFKEHLDHCLNSKGLEGYGSVDITGVAVDGWAEGPVYLLYDHCNLRSLLQQDNEPDLGTIINQRPNATNGNGL